jgi:predicted aspartyl protease
VRTIKTLQRDWPLRLRAGVMSALLVGWVLPAGAEPPAADSTTQETMRPAGTIVEAAIPQPVVEAEGEDPRDTLLAAPTTRDRIGRIMVKVMVNGQGPFPFVVDTGASHSTVSPTLVKTLGLNTNNSPPIELDGITGSALVPGVTVNSLEAGTWAAWHQPMPVLWAPVMGGAEGILGAAGLSEDSLMIDFIHDRVVISKSVDYELRARGLRVHGVRLSDGLLTIDSEVDGIRLKAVIDTGAERTLCNSALEKELFRREGQDKGVARVTSVYGATEDTVQGKLVQAPVVAIGTLRIVNMDIVCGNFHIFDVWGMADKPAMILGMDVLGTVSALGIDFKHHDLYVAGVRQFDNLGLNNSLHSHSGAQSATSRH